VKRYHHNQSQVPAPANERLYQSRFLIRRSAFGSNEPCASTIEKVAPLERAIGFNLTLSK